MKHDIDSQPSSFAGVGRYFRIVEAAGRIRVRFYFRNGTEYETTIFSGIGVRFPNDRYPEPFTKYELSSDTAQQIEVFAGDVEYTDNRTEGLQFIPVAGERVEFSQTQVTETAAEVVPPKADRRKVTFQVVNGTAFIGDSGVTVSNGLKLVTGSSIEFDSAAAFSMVSPQAETADVRIVEELN